MVKRNIRYDIADNTYEHFDFPTMGENMYRGRQAINQPPTGRTNEEKDG
jgi:hypothetical protein